MTPFEITFLIHCDTVMTSFQHIDAPLMPEIVQWMIKENLITPIDDRPVRVVYQTTGRGIALVKLLCDTKPPKQAWIDSQGHVIDTGKKGRINDICNESL